MSQKNPNKKFVVVSTQLIEAGVDIDLDVVYRDFSPLSSINQTAGRANRNGVGEDSSEVHIYRLKDDEKGRYFHNYIYPAFITDITRNILEGKEIVQEKDIFSLNEAYAEKITQKVSQDKSIEILEHIKNIDFKKLRDSFELIKNEYAFKRDIVIEADAECSQIIKEISELKRDKLLTKNKWEYNFKVKNLFRRLNQYKISIYESTYLSISDDLLKISGFDTEYLPLKSGTRVLYSPSIGIVSEAKSIEIL